MISKGKSHLASVRICGNKAYDNRRPMYDSDKVRNDINMLAWHLNHPKAKSERKPPPTIESKKDQNDESK